MVEEKAINKRHVFLNTKFLTEVQAETDIATHGAWCSSYNKHENNSAKKKLDNGN